MRILRIALLFFGTIIAACAASEVQPEANRYRLFSRDLVQLDVQGEPEVSVERRIDGAGEINVPLLGQVKVSGLTPFEAQAVIAQRYVQDEIFVRPEVVVRVIEYSPKEVMVLGQVGKQGKQVLPPEAVTLSIVEAITSAGGFTRIAKADAVRVTRKDEAGTEQSFTVNVEKMIQGRSPPREAFLLQPGDVIFVPERAF